MGQILLGMLLFTVDIDLTTETGRVIGLVPDFLGYLCVAWGMREMKTWSRNFIKGETGAIGVTLASAILYLAAIMGDKNAISFTLLGLNMVELGGMLLVLFWLTRGMQQIEEDAQRDLHTRLMMIFWICLTVVSVVAFGLSLFTRIGRVISMATPILAFCYIAAFFRCKVAFEEYLAEEN